MTVENFARREGQMFLLDLAKRGGAEMGKRSGRLVFRERFRLFLLRQFPGWAIGEISAEGDLEHSLSPAFPRALSEARATWVGRDRMSAGGRCGGGTLVRPDLAGVPAHTRTAGGRRRPGDLPAGAEGALDRAAGAVSRRGCGARELFTYRRPDDVVRMDPHDHGNLDTRLEQCRRPAPNRIRRHGSTSRFAGVERVPKHDGRSSLRVRGIEFAEIAMARCGSD